MFDSHALFKERLSNHIKELSRYLKYIFNGHLAIAMFFLISALAVYYQQILVQLPDNFPASWIIGISFGLLVSYTPVQTLLKEPDLVFLIPAEDKMNAYFRNALFYSYIVQLYLIFLVVAGLGPLYFHAFPERHGSVYLLTLFLVLIFKAWNLLASWWMQKIRDMTSRRLDFIVRLLLNCIVFYFIVNGNTILAGITTVLFIVLFFYVLSVSRRETGLAWELLVLKDQNRMQTFYRIANMFTDVPHLRNPIKRRHWLVSLIRKGIPFSHKYTYDYLYRITFIRSGDYLGMYLRLLIIGGLLIYFVPNDWLKLIFAILFLYMSSFQMMTLSRHYRTNMWLDLYPVEEVCRQKSIIKWLLQLGLVQTSIYAVIFLVMEDYIGLTIMLAGGIIFNVLFINGYVKRKL